MIRSLLFLACLSLLSSTGWGQQKPFWDQRMGRTVMTLWPVPGPGRTPFPKWSYDEGVILKGMEQLWRNTGDGAYFRYIQRQMDHFVTPDGRIPAYRREGYRLDDLNNGKVLLTLYRVTGQRKYWQAATLLRRQIDSQPRTPDGGFWHKKIYVQQMWLDGLYMAEPFLAEYAMLSGEDSLFQEITRQFTLMERHSRDSSSGLLYHGWDASRRQRWADPVTGRSPHFWGRAMGWYAMALVDALDYFPAHHPGRDTLSAILGRLATAVAACQDKASGCWYQVLDSAGAPGNYLEASASCMFVYALAKGTRKGYLPSSFHEVAARGFAGILKTFITARADGGIDLHGTCSVAGLGGDPYRDGSYAYYLSEKVVTNDPKGVGAFLLAAAEMRHRPADGVTVPPDHHVNDAYQAAAGGRKPPCPDQWTDSLDRIELSGLSLGHGALAAAARHAGKSVVVTVSAPWLYNEYTDGRKLPPEFHNFAAAGRLTDWLLRQAGAPAKH